MGERIFQVMIVPERSAKVRRYRIPYRHVVMAISLALVMAAGASFLSVHYLYVINEAANNHGLKNDNNQLKASLRIQQEELDRINGALQRIEQFSSKVRTIMRLSDPERSLAMGPLADVSGLQSRNVMYAKGERIDYEDELIDSKLAKRIIQSRLETSEHEALSQESNMRELNAFFSDYPVLLTSTPSVRPIASKLLNSTFGVRRDPYTGQRVMHKGVDFAADLGADVISTADGVVVFAGNRGKYGKTLVIDHASGLQTHYAHLSGFKTKVGDSVTRGQVIATAGNTGRTTGVHLHYEVRYKGIPEDPEKYILY